jgi:hypothetical protein
MILAGVVACFDPSVIGLADGFGQCEVVCIGNSVGQLPAVSISGAIDVRVGVIDECLCNEEPLLWV